VTSSCAAPFSWKELIAYHTGELPDADAARIEGHYFGCAHCSLRLEIVSRLDEGVDALVRGGLVMTSGTMALVQQARALGVIVREYRTDPGEHVDCTAPSTSPAPNAAYSFFTVSTWL
jgi:anti-sigma factor RsiW